MYSCRPHSRPLLQVVYPLSLQFIRNPDIVSPDLEGWAQAYFPDFGEPEFHKEVRLWLPSKICAHENIKLLLQILKKVKHTTIFQTYPDNFETELKRLYLELRGSEMSYYKAAKGGAISAIRVGFMDTSDVEKV
jgi:hypothetical protein